MEVHLSSELSVRKERALKRSLRVALATAFDGRVKFVQRPATYGQVSVTVELAKGEKPREDIFGIIQPIVDAATPHELNAKCSVRNCGETPKTTWHRWSSQRDLPHW